MGKRVPTAGPCHRLRKRERLLVAHAADEDSHQERRHLVVRHLSRGVALDDPLDDVFRQLSAAFLRFYCVEDRTSGGQNSLPTPNLPLTSIAPSIVMAAC